MDAQKERAEQKKQYEDELAKIKQTKDDEICRIRQNIEAIKDDFRYSKSHNHISISESIRPFCGKISNDSLRAYFEYYNGHLSQIRRMALSDDVFLGYLEEFWADTVTKVAKRVDRRLPRVFGYGSNDGQTAYEAIKKVAQNLDTVINTVVEQMEQAIKSKQERINELNLNFVIDRRRIKRAIARLEEVEMKQPTNDILER